MMRWLTNGARTLHQFISDANPPAGYTLVPQLTEILMINGPYFWKLEHGQVSCGFRVMPRHVNRNGVCHGGVIATFADMQMDAYQEALPIPSITGTISLQIDYMASPKPGDWVEGWPEVLNTTRRLLFCQTMLRVGQHPIARGSCVFRIATQD